MKKILLFISLISTACAEKPETFSPYAVEVICPPTCVIKKIEE